MVHGPDQWEHFAPAVTEAEIAIYESDLSAGRRLTDQDVVGSLDRMIQQLADSTQETTDDALNRRIWWRWRSAAGEFSGTFKAALTLNVRDLRNKVTAASETGPGSRNYLNSLEGGAISSRRGRRRGSASR